MQQRPNSDQIKNVERMNANISMLSSSQWQNAEVGALFIILHISLQSLK